MAGPREQFRALSYLARARFGLTEPELLDVLSADETVMADLHDRNERRGQRPVSKPGLVVAVHTRAPFRLQACLPDSMKTSRHAAGRWIEGAGRLPPFRDVLSGCPRLCIVAQRVNRRTSRQAPCSVVFRWLQGQS